MRNLTNWVAHVESTHDLETTQHLKWKDGSVGTRRSVQLWKWQSVTIKAVSESKSWATPLFGDGTFSRWWSWAEWTIRDGNGGNPREPHRWHWRQCRETRCQGKTETHIDSGDFSSNGYVTMSPAWEDRRRTRSVRQKLFRSAKKDDQIASTRSFSTSRRRRSSRIQNLGTDVSFSLVSIGQFEHGWISCKKEEVLRRDFSIVWIRTHVQVRGDPYANLVRTKNENQVAKWKTKESGFSLKDKKEQILAEVRSEIQKHELQADSDRRSIQELTGIVDSQRMEPDHTIAGDEQLRRDQLLLQEQLSEQNRDLREAHIKSLFEMKELKRVQELRVDESPRRRSIEVKTLSINSRPKFRNCKYHT